MILAVKRGSASANLAAPDAQGLYWVAGLDLDLPVHRSLEYLVEGSSQQAQAIVLFALRAKSSLSFCGPARNNTPFAQFFLKAGSRRRGDKPQLEEKELLDRITLPLTENKWLQKRTNRLLSNKQRRD